MRLLIFDNYDSFTFNLAHAMRELGVEPEVKRNDTMNVEDAAVYDKIIISPGPGIPCEAGILPQLLERYATCKPILGVCLGHQAIAECFGGKLSCLDQVHHGVASEITLTGDDYVFHGLPEHIEVGRYHSWVVDPQSLPDELEVIATTAEGQIMALRHKKFDIRGVQFHPESILTPCGMEILSNWLNH